MNCLCESNADQPNREKSLVKSDMRILNMCNSNGCVFRLLSELLVLLNIDDLLNEMFISKHYDSFLRRNKLLWGQKK